MNDTDIAHLAGAFDMKGHVTVEIFEKQSAIVGYTFIPKVQFSRPRWDETMVGKVTAYCEENYVTYDLIERSGKKTPDYLIEIQGADNVRKFLTPLVPHLVTKYPPAMTMLEQILPRYEDKRHLTKPGFYEMMRLVDYLREFRQGGHTKYSQDYFAELWGDEIDVEEVEAEVEAEQEVD